MIETEIKFKTLTPIWTGDTDRKCTTIKDTSIIGSMRWWYETIIGEIERYDCDPSNGGCEFGTKGYISFPHCSILFSNFQIWWIK
ncbi:type III-B CRISPR module RAMP protein Cmr1 [Methanosarcina siciliae]|uniref:type III-B CRISPR module RAMP protein Cmr1 n=1 Tax=Methanosarcina siciliae TaxID=38027 RepID=UPI00064EB34A